MKEFLLRLNRLLPRRLTMRMTLVTVIITISAGIITLWSVNELLAWNLRTELINSGEALTMSLGESLANELVDGNLVSIQEILDIAVRNNEEVLYAYAFAPNIPIVHSFPGGFPSDLYSVVADYNPDASNILLSTEWGVVRDFRYRPLDGLPAEVHLGVSQKRIETLQHQVTVFILMLTIVGCLVAAVAAYGLNHLISRPLRELTHRVQRLGQGHLGERIDLPLGDEVGDLASAFNRMAADIKSSIEKLQTSEKGYRDLLTAASVVGEGIALIGDEGREEGTFLFVNETFAHLAGYHPADLLGVNAGSILHPESLSAAKSAWGTIRTGNSFEMPSELTLLDRRGHTHILETAGTLIEYQDQHALAWFTRDISQRKLREEALRRRNRELTALNAVSSAIGEPHSPEEILNQTLQQALRALELDIGWVSVLSDDGQVQMTAGQGMEAVPEEIDLSACQCLQALDKNKPTVLKSANHNCTVHRFLSDKDCPPVCQVSVPIQVHGKTLGALSVVSGDATIFDQEEIALLSSLGQQMGVALENARLWEELRLRESRRSELLDRALNAQEEERQRIARELHDGIGQSLNALVFGLNAVSTAMDEKPPIVPELVETLKVSASDTVKELQAIIYDLRPSLLDDLGLVRALRWYAEERLETQGIEVTLDVPDDERRLPPKVETTLFRVAQEGITNICKYAQACKTSIRLQIEPHQVCMEIADDGIGFEARAALSYNTQQGKWGLLGIQERAALLGGVMTIESEHQKGSRLIIVLPLEKETS